MPAGTGQLGGAGAGLSATGRAYVLSGGADALRIYAAGVEVVSLTAVGTIPGVVITHAAAANGPGAGRLRYDEDGLAWQPPGESAYGDPVTVVSGDYRISGADESQFLRVTVHHTYLVTGTEGRVFLADRYANAIGHDDVTAAEASAGQLAYYQLTLANDSPETLYQLTGWVDVATPGLKMSADGATYLAGAAFGDLAPGATATCYLRRTITAGAESDPEILAHLHFRFDTETT